MLIGSCSVFGQMVNPPGLNGTHDDNVRFVQTMADGTVVMTVMPTNRNKARIVELPPDSSPSPVVNGHAPTKDSVSKTLSIQIEEKIILLQVEKLFIFLSIEV